MTYQILANDDQMLILCPSNFITTVSINTCGQVHRCMNAFISKCLLLTDNPGAIKINEYVKRDKVKKHESVSSYDIQNQKFVKTHHGFFF